MITSYKVKNSSGGEITFGNKAIANNTEYLITEADIRTNGDAVVSDISQFSTLNNLISTGDVEILKEDVAIEYATFSAQKWFKAYYDSKGESCYSEYVDDHIIDSANAHEIAHITNLQTSLDAKENSLGVPSGDSYVLEADSDGTRRWIAKSGIVAETPTLDAVVTKGNLVNNKSVDFNYGTEGSISVVPGTSEATDPELYFSRSDGATTNEGRISFKHDSGGTFVVSKKLEGQSYNAPSADKDYAQKGYVDTKETSLGNPDTNGKFLISQTDGTRSWANLPTVSAPGLQEVTDVNSETTHDITVGADTSLSNVKLAGGVDGGVRPKLSFKSVGYTKGLSYDGVVDKFTLDSLLVGSSYIAPSSNSEYAQKKYVDDQVAGVVSGMDYKGTFDATSTAGSGEPEAADANGQYWKVATAGSYDLGGITDWNIGDFAIYVEKEDDTFVWQKIDNTETPQVQSDWAASGSMAEILNKPSDITDLTTHSATELNDIVDAGSGSIVTTTERDDWNNAKGDIDSHVGETNIHFEVGSISHNDINDIGSTSHDDIDNHINDTDIHFAKDSISHSTISDLDADDHTQYHNDDRGDVRYYQKTETYEQTEVDSLLENKIDVQAGHAVEIPVFDNDGQLAASGMTFSDSGHTLTTVLSAKEVDDRITAASPTIYKDFIYEKTGVISYHTVINKNESASINNGFLIPNDGKTYKLLGFKIDATSGQTTQATNVAIRAALQDADSGTQYTVAGGTTMAQENLLTVGAAAPTKYYISEEKTLASSVTLTNGKFLMFDLNVLFWTLTDVTITAIISVE